MESPAIQNVWFASAWARSRAGQTGVARSARSVEVMGREDGGTPDGKDSPLGMRIEGYSWTNNITGTGSLYGRRNGEWGRGDRL
eukprot:g78257.t1